MKLWPHQERALVRTREAIRDGARAPLIVCPTSWTPDEDFDLLLEALERAERQLKSDVPMLVVILTGRGPLREVFEARLARRHLTRLERP